MIRKPLSMAQIYSTIIVSAMIVSILFQFFILSNENNTVISLLTNHKIQYAIAGVPSEKKQLLRNNNQLTLQCDATDLTSVTMCGIVLFISKDEKTKQFASFKSYDRISANILALSESSRYSGKVKIFIKTIYDLNNPSLEIENTKYQAVIFNPQKIDTLKLADFNVENWWLNKYEIPYANSHKDFNNVVSLEVYISDIPLIHASHYTLKINNLSLQGKRIYQNEFNKWMSIIWPLLIIVLLFHYLIHTKIILNKSKKLIYTDKETGFFNADKLVRDYSDLSNEKLQVHSLKIKNYKTLCEKIGKDLTIDIIVFTWNRCTIELEKNELTVYRIKDNEFVILKTGTPLTKKNYNIVFDICSLGTNIKNCGQFSLDIALGIIEPSDLPDTAQELIESCLLITDYAEKYNKKIVYYGMEPLKLHKEELFILNSIKKSFNNNDFYLQFMPIYNRKDNCLSGVEAILRSHSIPLSDYQPETYISVAEKHGYIRKIDLWVIEQTFKTMISHCKNLSDNFKFSINISSREMLDNSFIDEFKSLLAQYNINPACLCLEITETFFVDINEYEIKNISELRNLGCSISLDDFATGYTSFPSLLKLPANEIKIDKTYVSNMGNPNIDILIQSFINIAKIYDYVVVAEGVETKEQLETLYEMGCDHFQGYYISRPTDFSAILQMS